MQQKLRPPLNNDRHWKQTKDFKNVENIAMSQALLYNSCLPKIPENELRQLMDKIAYIEKLLTLCQHQQDHTEDERTPWNPPDPLQELPLRPEYSHRSPTKHREQVHAPTACKLQRQTISCRSAITDEFYNSNGNKKTVTCRLRNATSKEKACTSNSLQKIEILPSYNSKTPQRNPEKQSLSVLFMAASLTPPQEQQTKRTLKRTLVSKLEPNKMPEVRHSAVKSNDGLNSQICNVYEKNKANHFQNSVNYKNTVLNLVKPLVRQQNHETINKSKHTLTAKEPNKMPEVYCSAPRSNGGFNLKSCSAYENIAKYNFQVPCDCKKSCLNRSDTLQSVCLADNYCEQEGCWANTRVNCSCNFECSNSCAYVNSIGRLTRKCNQLLINVSDEMAMQRKEMQCLKLMTEKCLKHILEQDKKFPKDFCNCLPRDQRKSTQLLCYRSAEVKKGDLLVENISTQKNKETKQEETKTKKKSKRCCLWPRCCKKKSKNNHEKDNSKASPHVEYEKPENPVEDIGTRKPEENASGDQNNLTPSANESSTNKKGTEGAASIKPSKKSRCSLWKKTSSAKTALSKRSSKAKSENERDKRQNKGRCWLLRLCKYCC